MTSWVSTYRTFSGFLTFCEKLGLPSLFTMTRILFASAAAADDVAVREVSVPDA